MTGLLTGLVTGLVSSVTNGPGRPAARVAPD